METDFITPEKRSRVKSAFEALGTGWSFYSVRKVERSQTWKLVLAPVDESQEKVVVILGEAELEGIIEGGPSGDRAFAKIRQALQVSRFRQAP